MPTEPASPNRRRQMPPAAELTSVLNRVEKPLTLGELSQQLGRPFRAVAWALSAACKAGSVDRLEGGLYRLGRSPALSELLDIVQACEAEWMVDDQLAQFGPSAPNLLISMRFSGPNADLLGSATVEAVEWED
jgi:hypothetical protein